MRVCGAFDDVESTIRQFPTVSSGFSARYWVTGGLVYLDAVSQAQIKQQRVQVECTVDVLLAIKLCVKPGGTSMEFLGSGSLRKWESWINPDRDPETLRCQGPKNQQSLGAKEPAGPWREKLPLPARAHFLRSQGPKNQ